MTFKKKGIKMWEIPITVENIEQITFNQLKKITIGGV